MQGSPLTPRSLRCPDDRDAVLGVTVAEKILDDFGRRIFFEEQAACRDLPAGIAKLAADPQRRHIAVELDIAHFDRCAAAADRDHRPVRRGHFGEAAAGYRAVHRSAGLWIERAVEQVRRATKARWLA